MTSLEELDEVVSTDLLIVGGGIGGLAAARYAAANSQSEINAAEVSQLKEQTFAPMDSDKKYSPWDAINAWQDVVAPMKYSLFHSWVL